jgi:hypothetical protein
MPLDNWEPSCSIELKKGHTKHNQKWFMRPPRYPAQNNFIYLPHPTPEQLYLPENNFIYQGTTLFIFYNNLVLQVLPYSTVTDFARFLG